MKQIICILIFVLGFLSCNNQIVKKKTDQISIDTIRTDSTDKEQTNITIKDKSQYDQTFIEGLYDYNERIILENNYIITGNDTTYFPDDFPLNKEIVFKGDKDKKDFILKISRKNLTDLTYNFVITDNDIRTVDSKSGKAILGSMFFLAAEMDNDSQTGEVYASYEYWDNTNDCWFAIRIGYGRDEKGKQRAKLTYGCKDQNKLTLSLDECPTLKTE